MIDPRETLKAGGMVPATAAGKKVIAKLGKDAAVDVVVARAYRHGVLPNRTIVRLTADNVVTGDDLEMATLGFGAGEDRGPVAMERKRPLGFPGWALVHDPQNARYALDVVKELKKHARRAKSKPGHAKDGIDALAKQLGKVVPHFLPSFYEEAGRAFLEHGSQKYAAEMFGKAREAEAVHALDVDEQHRIDGFLEFALAGAVTTKALAQYAKDLADHHEPKAAYAHFRQLCVQRTLGGMPPWSGMAKELGRLAKAAKLDPDAEDAAFVAEIIESPALAKAALEFWRAYADPIAELGKRDPVARGVLLNLFPTGTTYNSDLDDTWLDLLERSGAIQALVSNDAPEVARPAGGRAAWFDKLTQHLARSWRESTISVRVFDLLRRMAPMLVADGTPLQRAGRWRLDLDIVEQALELGIAFAPEDNAHFDLEGWAKRVAMPERGRDPVRVAAHPVLGPMLQRAVAGEIGDEPWDTASLGKAGFLAAKRAWIESQLVAAETGALPALATLLETVASKVKAATFAEVPDLHARFAALDIPPLLARTLRAGILDEYGWPALEAVAAELSPDGKTPLTLHGGPPAAILATRTHAVAIGRDGKLAEHDFVIPAKLELATVRYIQGEFLVVLKAGYRLKAYWSSAPHDVWDVENLNSWYVPSLANNACVTADGAWLEGPTPIRKGDRKITLGAAPVAFDGATAWVSRWDAGELRWHEVTTTGEHGRQSWPAWVEAAIAEGDDWRIDGSSSSLFPAPQQVTDSPLGARDGLVGFRVRYQGKNLRERDRSEIESIDGARFACPPKLRPNALLRRPDDDVRLSVTSGSEYRGLAWQNLHEPNGDYVASRLANNDASYHRGQAAFLPFGFWHLFVARDVEGSRRLHALSDDAARALMAAVPRRTHATGATVDGEVVAPDPYDVTGGIVDITHPRLASGITGLAILAVEQQQTRDKLVVERSPDAAKAARSGGPDDETLVAALQAWLPREWGQAGRGWSQIALVGDAFASEDRSDRSIDDLPRSSFHWFELALAPWSLAFLATAIGTPPAHRKVMADVLAHLTATLPPPDRLRLLRGQITPGRDRPAFEVRWAGGNAYALRRQGYSNLHYWVLEYAPTGDFKPPPEVSVDADTRGIAAEGRTGPAAVAAVAAAIAEGKTSWSGERAVEFAARTGLTPSEATLVLAGCPALHDRSSNFLDKELRETLGLKVNQAAIARDGLAAIPLAKRRAAIDAAGRLGVSALLDGSGLAAFATAWQHAVGKRVAIPEELVAEADDVFDRWGAPIEPSPALAMIASPHDSDRLTVDGTWAFAEDGDIIQTSKPEPLIGQTKLPEVVACFDDSALRTAIAYIPFVYEHLPVGDSLRAQAVAAYELVQQRLKNPALWIDGGSTYLENDEANAGFDRMLDGLGGEALPGPVDGDGRRAVRFPGAVVFRAGHRATMRLQPATIDARSRGTVEKLGTVIAKWTSPVIDVIDYARGDELRAIVERIIATPVPEGGWEQNPLASAPKLVDRAATALGVSREAAGLYLQYLVLLWPTPKLLARCNGWKPKQLDEAQQELVDKELLLEAKRERAQRGHFLPGGWEALKSPEPPMESWKLPLYGSRTADGKPAPRFRKFQPLAAFHQLFERAWQRIEAGDVPRYEEVKR